MTDPFYSYGNSVLQNTETRAAEREQLRKDAERNAFQQDQSIPVPITVNGQNKRFVTASGVPARSCKSAQPAQMQASPNPYVAAKRNEELDTLVAKRAHQMKLQQQQNFRQRQMPQ